MHDYHSKSVQSTYLTRLPQAGLRTSRISGTLPLAELRRIVAEMVD